jgi:hypothetical protein
MEAATKEKKAPSDSAPQCPEGHGAVGSTLAGEAADNAAGLFEFQRKASRGEIYEGDE